ncbi:MAG TPA: hypothetical protein DCS66_12915, partial [Flavobacteriaceae bacterium]|nr:hypothetical protein [Flavobacteriaceae bacterium]
MATELEAIIQRMRAEGRSEEDIAKVVAEHKARKANPPVKAVAEIEPSSEIVNVDGVDVSLGQEEDKKESEEWKTQLANSLNTKKVISENPILNEDGSPNTEVTQQNIDNIPSPIAFTPKQPEGIVIDTEIDYKASLGLPNDLTK